MGSEGLKEPAVETGSGTIVLLHQFSPLTLRGKWELHELHDRSQNAHQPISLEHLILLHGRRYAVALNSLPEVSRALGSGMNQINFSVQVVDNLLSTYYLFFEGAFVPEEVQTNFSFKSSKLERQSMHGEFNWKALDEELRQNKLLLETAIQSDVIAWSVLKPVFTADQQIQDFVWVMANKLLRAMAHGQNVIGMRYTEVFPDASRNGVLAQLIKAYVTRQRQTNEVYYQDAYIKGWMRESYYRALEYVMVSGEDITWQKHVSDELKSSQDRLLSMNASIAQHAEAQYWELFQSIDQGFAILKEDDTADKPGDFIFVQTNPAFEQMMGSSAIAGKGLKASLPDLFKELSHLLNEVLIKRRSMRRIMSAGPTEGRYYEVFIFVTGANFRKLGVLFSDVTKQRLSEIKLKLLNANLVEADREKSSFFTRISQEFKTPLMLMLGTLNELVQTKGDSPEGEISKLRMVTRNAARLQKLVNGLLDLTKAETRIAETYYQPTDIASLTLNLTSTFRSVIEQAGLKYRCDIKPFNEPVYLNQEMWAKIVFNLLSNAFKFTLHGRIDVILKEKQRNIQLQVRDTGIGIPESEIPKLFRRFSKVEHSAGRTNEGSGIGLSLVKDFVVTHGGTISVRSKEGTGSVFTVMIPKGKAHLLSDQIYQSAKENDRVDTSLFAEEASSWVPESQKSKTAVPSLAKQKLRNRPCVMVVDDNADMREFLSGILQESYHVIAVENGLKAIKILLKGMHPDLILTDVMMPELDGFGLISAVKSNKALSHIPTILLSGRSADEAKMEGYRNGADDYIAKPFTADELRTVIQARLLMAAARKTAHQELLTQNAELGKDIQAQTAILMEHQSTVRRQNEELIALNGTLQRRNYELKVAAEELSNFSQITAHDLREPLRKIAFYCSRLLESAGRMTNPESTFVSKINQSIQRMMFLLNDVKKYAELRSPEINGAQPVDLRALITRAWNKLTDDAVHCNASIHLSTLCVLRGNPSQLIILFQNLLSNAIKFRFPNTSPLIIISGKYIDSTGLGEPYSTFNSRYYELSIADNGIGCDQSYTEKIFNMFQKLNGPDEFQGSGMGLAICKRIIENHRGMITVKSEPGLGSTFICYFPATPA